MTEQDRLSFTARHSLRTIRLSNGRWYVRFEVYDHVIYMLPEEAEMFSSRLLEEADEARQEEWTGMTTDDRTTNRTATRAEDKETRAPTAEWKTEKRCSGRIRLRARDLLSVAGTPKVEPGTELHLTFRVPAGDREMVVTGDSIQVVIDVEFWFTEPSR